MTGLVDLHGCLGIEWLFEMFRILIVGGARAGKSSYALQCAEDAVSEKGMSGVERVFVATAQRSDGEMSARIDRHQSERDAGWRTVEEPLEICDVIAEECNRKSVVVVDCLTLWLNNLMLHDRDVDAEVERLASCISEVDGDLIIVSNELGLGLVPDTVLGRVYRDAHGVMNRVVAEKCDRVVFMVAGLPMVLKGE